MPLIPAVRKLRKENQMFEVRMGYIVKPCLKTKEKEWVFGESDLIMRVCPPEYEWISLLVGWRGLT
jgi:hypothetical protein